MGMLYEYEGLFSRETVALMDDMMRAAEHDGRDCSKGWDKRCPAAQCGGDNHGRDRPPTIERNRLVQTLRLRGTEGSGDVEILVTAPQSPAMDVDYAYDAQALYDTLKTHLPVGTMACLYFIFNDIRRTS